MDMQAYWARVRREQGRLCALRGDCAMVKQKLEDYSPAELRAHLEGCPACGNAVVVLRSKATANGGVAGRFCQVDTLLAARFIVDQSHELATEEEAARWLAELREEQERARAERAKQQLQVAIIQGGTAGIELAAPKATKGPGK